MEGKYQKVEGVSPLNLLGVKGGKELKRVVNFSTADIYYTPTFWANYNGSQPNPTVCLSLISKGYTDQQRIGRRINIVAVDLSLQISMNYHYPFLENHTYAPVVRVVAFVDKMPGQFLVSEGGAQPTDLFSNVGDPTYQVLSPYNLSATERFTILKDKTFTIDNYQSYSTKTVSGEYDGRLTGWGFSGRTNIVYKCCIKMNIESTYQNVGGGTDDFPVTNAVNVIAMSNYPDGVDTSVTPVPRLDMVNTMSYYDC